MSIKSDKWILEQCYNNGMIEPFFEKSIKEFPDGRKIPSFGVSTTGYDLRLGRNFTVFKPETESFYIEYGRDRNSTSHLIRSYEKEFVDILDFDAGCVEEIEDVDWIILPPHSFVLAHTEEYLKIPRNVACVFMNKSTIARMGIILNTTPGEPGWSGYLTLEISNTTDLPIKIHSGIGIVQAQFFESDQEPLVSYSDRQGKYQNQPKKPVLARN